MGAIKYDYAELSNDSTVIMRASDALQRQSGVCQHFAAVFVSLARGLKLPARVIEGYHLSDMPDGSVKAGGHAWVEVLIAGKVWLPIEPQSNDAYSIQKYFPMEYFPIAPMQAYNSKDGIVSENFKDAMAIMAMLGLSFKN